MALAELETNRGCSSNTLPRTVGYFAAKIQRQVRFRKMIVSTHLYRLNNRL